LGKGERGAASSPYPPPPKKGIGEEGRAALLEEGDKGERAASIHNISLYFRVMLCIEVPKQTLPKPQTLLDAKLPINTRQTPFSFKKKLFDLTITHTLVPSFFFFVFQQRKIYSIIA
jgi:hypothetical protein